MKGRVCPKCGRRTVIYVHGLKLSWCTNSECKHEDIHSSYEEHMKAYPKKTLDMKDVFEKIPGITGLISKRVNLTEDILALGLHAIATEERIEQGYIERQEVPPFSELPEEPQDVYRVIARFIIKCFVPKE